MIASLVASKQLNIFLTISIAANAATKDYLALSRIINACQFSLLCLSFPTSSVMTIIYVGPLDLILYEWFFVPANQRPRLLQNFWTGVFFAVMKNLIIVWNKP